MSSLFAKDQPDGFVNRIERVAIVGANGQIGRYIVEALLQTGRHEITALTRDGASAKFPSGIRVVQVDYDDEASLVSALRDQQILIISLAAMAPPGTHDKIVTAAAKAGVPRIMPNTWGANLEDPAVVENNLLGATYTDHVRRIEQLGLAWTSLCCSYWYEFSLGTQKEGFGFGVKDKTVTLYSGGETRINTTTWEQCGRAVAAWLGLKILPEDENDASATVSSWTNKSIYISSFLLSQRDMLASLERVQGNTERDWKISDEDVEERAQRGLRLLQEGDMSGYVIALYAKTFSPNGHGDYETPRGGLDNEVLGLPKESLDDATRRALELAEAA